MGGCLMIVGGLFSFGVFPLLVWLDRRKYPAAVDDDGMLLRNGTKVPWGEFTRAQITKVHVNGRYVTDRLDLWHSHGTTKMDYRFVEDAPRVVDFIVRHLPARAVAREEGASR